MLRHSIYKSQSQIPNQPGIYNALLKDFRETINFSQPISIEAQVAFKCLIRMLRKQQPDRFFFTASQGLYVVAMGKDYKRKVIELDIKKPFIVINYQAAMADDHQDLLKLVSASFPAQQDFIASRPYKLIDGRVIIWADDVSFIEPSSMQQAMLASLIQQHSAQDKFLAYYPYKISLSNKPILLKRPLCIRKFDPKEVGINTDIYEFLLQTQEHNPIFTAGMLLPYKSAATSDMQFIQFGETIVMRPRSASKPGHIKFAIKMLPLDYVMLDQDNNYEFGKGGMSTVERFGGKVCYDDKGMLFFQQLSTRRSRAGKSIKDYSIDEKYSAVKFAENEAMLSQQGAPWLKMCNPVHGKDAEGKNTSYLFLRLFSSNLLNILVVDSKAGFKKLAVSDRFKIIAAILSQLSYMHAHDVVHVDGKVDNVCFESPTDMTSAKIIDFGLSKRISEMVSEFAGSEDYIAPEVLDGAPFSTATEMFNYGTLFIYILGCTDEYNYSNIYYDKRDEKRKIDVVRPTIKNMFFGMRDYKHKDEFYLSKLHRRQLYELICEGMCNIDPAKRPTWTKVNTEIMRIRMEHEELQQQYKTAATMSCYKP